LIALHIDMPTRTDIERLASAREDFSVTVYVPTNPETPDSELDRLTARALFEDAIARVRESADKDTAAAVEGQLLDLLDDNLFWRYVGRSLAVFVTPARMLVFRLPNELGESVSVSDRFSITPILRAITFPHAAFVLALSQHGARLVKVSADMQLEEIPFEVGNEAAKTADLTATVGRADFGKPQGDDGHKVRQTQFARAVDHGLRPILNGQSLPLIIAATQPLLSIFRNLSGYAHVAAGEVRGNPDELTDAQLAEGAREILDALYAADLADVHSTFLERESSGRSATDLSDLAHAAARGAVGTLAVDMDAVVAGSVEDDGSLTFDADSDLNVLEEIARLTLAHGGRVLSLRASDLPGEAQAVGILRYAL
jgi:hypothetical protein